MRKLVQILVLSCASLGALPARADEHAASCADAYTKAQQLRNGRKFLEARNALRICVQPGCTDFIVRDCTRWLDEVQASLPSVVPVAKDDAGNDLPEVAVTMDGTVLVPKIDGRSFEIDPGPHAFTFTAGDGRKLDKSVVVTEGAKDERVVAVFPKAQTEVATSPAPLVNPTGPAPVAAPAHTVPPWRTIGLMTAGAGVVGLGVGAAFGIAALDGKSSAGCVDQNGQTVCQKQGPLTSAQQSGNVSTVLFVAGGALTAAGVVLWFVAPQGTAVQAGATASSGGGGFTVRGSF